MRKLAPSAAAIVLMLAAAAFAQTLPSGVQKKASVGGITEYQFPNGLRVLLYPDQANPKVTINVTCLVGSRHEGYGETGMIVSHGAAWNGTTSSDRTNYFETVPATATPYKQTATLNRKIETPDKANAQFEAGLRFRMSDKDPDYPAMLLAGYMFGGPITSRISDRIRNREGLSYGANARVAIPFEGDAAMLSGTVSLNPVNGPKVEASFQDELAKTLREGFTAAEVVEAKKAFLDSRMVSRAQDAALLALLATHEQEVRTMQWDEQVERKVHALTSTAINAAFRKHIDAASLAIVKAGDFKAAGIYQ